MFSKFITFVIATNLLINAVPIVSQPKGIIKPVNNILSKVVGATDESELAEPASMEKPEPESAELASIENEAEDEPFDDFEFPEETGSLRGFSFPEPSMEPIEKTEQSSSKSGTANKIDISNKVVVKPYGKGKDKKMKKHHYPKYYDEDIYSDEDKYDSDY